MACLAVMRGLVTFGAVWCAAFVSGCGSEETLPNLDEPASSDSSATSDESRGETSRDTTTAGTRSENSGDTSSEEPVDIELPVCEVPIVNQTHEPVPFAKLTATVIDETGAPVSKLLTQACGLDVCLNGETNTKGETTIAGDHAISKLAFKYGDGLYYAQVALLLPEETSHDLGKQRTLRLPLDEATDYLEPGKTSTSSGVKVTLSEDATVHIDELSYADPSEHRFVAKGVTEAFPAAAEGQGFVSLWALGPAKTELCPPAELTLPNSTQLEPESSVELLLLVTDVSGRWGRYGEWTKVAAARVTKDGKHLVTDRDHGIPELGLLGVRPVQ